MWRYVFLTIRRQPGKSVLAGSGFLLAACALILLSATTQTTVVQANQIISQSWRSSYDLVVLPPQAQLATQSILPADLLAGYDGGISLQQYQQIKGLPGVEVAAPIAYLGYVQMPVPRVLFSKQTLAPGYYRLDWTLTAFNGQHDIVERKETIYDYVVPSNCTNYPLLNLEEKLSTQGIYLDCASPAAPWSEFSTVDSGTFLLAAIDPTAENQLVHLGKSVSNGRMLSSQDGIQFETDPNLGNALDCPNGQTDPLKCRKIPNYSIPVLFHTQVPGQITLRGRFARIASVTLDPRTVLLRGGAAYLAQLSPLQTLFDGVVPLVQNDPQRFSTREVLWDGHSWQPFISFNSKNPPYYNVNFLYTPSGLTYQPTKPPPGQPGPAYVVLPNGVQEPEVAFRQLHPLHIAQGATLYTPQAYYFFDFVGQFAGDTLAAQFSNPLNWLPENTYTSPPAILRYNARGNPVNPINLLPTTNPAGFTLQPPLAITTLSAAERLRGDHIISAIRIRVSGVQVANPASWKRVQQVAASIEQRTGLRVLVTLGSSPSPTLVYVPGVKQGQFGATHTIQPIGWVEERWIAIGASILYLSQLGSTRLLLLGSVLGVCLGYLVVAFSALITAQRREFAVLSALGWRPWQPARLFLAQALFLALAGGIVGLGIALLIATLLEAIPIWLIVIWTLPVIVLMALLSSLYPLWQIWQIRPTEIMRAGSSVTSGRIRLSSFRLGSAVPSIGILVLRNLGRSRPRTLISIVSLCLSTILLLLMFSSILALHQTLTGTLLGNFVLLKTAVPQIAGCIFAMLLSFFSVADLLLLQVQDRQQEIGLLQAVGWRPGMVKRLFVQEGLVLAIMSALLGILIAQFVLSIQHTIQSILPAPILALIVLVLMMLVAALATIPALRALNKMQIADILRAEYGNGSSNSWV
jgi:putative ABC transport system permease protein